MKDKTGFWLALEPRGLVGKMQDLSMRTNSTETFFFVAGSNDGSSFGSSAGA
jgi:hypothetical protein